MEIGKLNRGEEDERKNKEGRGQNWGKRKNERKKDTKEKEQQQFCFLVLQKEKRFFFPPKSVTDRGYNEIRPPEKNDHLTLFQRSPFYQQGL